MRVLRENNRFSTYARLLLASFIIWIMADSPVIAGQKSSCTSSVLSLFPSSGTSYVIHSRIDLDGQTVVVPPDCTINFKSGELTNGSIVFQNTFLAGKVRIRCDISGTIKNDVVQIDWFINPAKNKTKVDDSSNMIQAIFDASNGNVVFGKGYYRFSHIDASQMHNIVGEGTTILPVELAQDKYDFHFLKNVFYAREIDTLAFRGLFFEGELSETILPDFKSDDLFGEPLIWVNDGDAVLVERCSFKNIENCTYCNKAYNYYGNKQGSCVCLWDVSDSSILNCEQVGNRHDEQIWIIAVDKSIMDTKVTYRGNYIHDMTPGPNSSAFTCVAGSCLMENNRVSNFNYPGSMFNAFAKRLIIRNNTIRRSYCSSVFDTCEYSYFHNDDVEVYDNYVEAINSVLVLAQSERTVIRNNVYKGLGLYYSANNRVQHNKYKHWYTIENDVQPTDVETIIDHNNCDFTLYDGNRSIAGTKVNYGTGEVLEPVKYSNVGVNYGCGILIHPNEAKAGLVRITNNTFKSLQSLDGAVDKNHLAALCPYTIKLVNTNGAEIIGNSFDGCYPLYQNPSEYTCISVYNYPDVMEKMEKPGLYSLNPTQYGAYTVTGNVFKVKVPNFIVVSVTPRNNSVHRDLLSIKELTIENNILPSTVRNASCLYESSTVNVMKSTLDERMVRERI